MDVFTVYSVEQFLAGERLFPKGLPPELQRAALIEQLHPIDATSFARVAKDTLDNDGQRRTDDGAFQLNREELIELLDGLEGVERIERNAHILIHIANLLEAEGELKQGAAAEMFIFMRSLWWNVDRIRASTTNQTFKYWFEVYGRNVVLDYCNIMRVFLTLHQGHNEHPFFELDKRLFGAG